ncbi:sensor histidine kinase [Actinomadura flavalba]|uniref:sensor histidine kinase n=1 Tax=Actinomadura flavalba TaxID=1120938 RepID=UPI00037C1635|nr:HAMP domain-containing sensor histidine kinase [Actinomadura flavalba]
MTLNARLLTGLLAVSAAGLLVTGLVSALVLHDYLMRRVDGQLEAARDRTVARLVNPGLPDDTTAPALFVVAVVTRDGRIRVLSAPDVDPSPAVAELTRLGSAGVARRAADLRPFSLPDLRAVARPARNGNYVVVATPLAEIDAAVRNLVLTELITALLLLTVLGLVGRRLIQTGLLPLGRMAGTAQAITAGGDLRARMPGPGERDETARLAAAINVMLERIEQAFHARVRSEARVREFAADASHELRTPLTTIQGYAELYRHGALDDAELPAAMSRIEAEAQRMSRLVGDLLDLARLDREAGLRPESADLVPLAREAVADASAAAPGRVFTLDAPPTLRATVDEARTRQILGNLLANVREHTPPDTAATVRLTASATVAIIEVTDDGPGMTPQNAARAFERFHRADPAPDGTGLGLPIVAAIASAHGGEAVLRSSPGHGTTVRVTLPLR